MAIERDEESAECPDAKAVEPFRVYARNLRAREGVSFECVWRLLDDDDKFIVRTFHMGKPPIDLECTGRALEELDRLEALEKDELT